MTAAALPPAPTLGGALRAGASDLFYNSWRVVPANLAFGGGLVIVVWAWIALGIVPAAALAVALAAPIAGLFRLGALAARGRDVNLSDALDPVRAAPGPVLGAGAAFSAAMLVLATNVVTGVLAGGILAWMVATLAFWGLAWTVAFGFAFWPLAVDPERVDVPWRARARLAVLLVLAHPVRMGLLALVLVIVLAVSTVAFAVLATVGMGFAALVACRFVLPAADRLEARLGERSAAG